MFPYVMTPALRDKIRAADEANNPYTRYIEFYTNTWSVTKDWPSYAYYNWVRTGNPDDLAKAIAGDPPYYGSHGNYRQSAVYHIALYHLLKEHMTEERRADYENKLKMMATSAIQQVRAWDADERITIYLMCMMMDAEFGTSYTTADSTDPTSPYYVAMESMQACYNMIVEAFQTDFKDGATSESMAYTINTYNMVLFAIGCLGKDCIPGVREWLPKFKEFWLWAQSSDLNYFLEYGDTEQSQNNHGVLAYHYRLPLIWSLIGLGEDEDGRLADLSTALINKWKGGGNPITSPNQLHPILNIGGMYLLDPTVLPATPRTTLEHGWKWIYPGIGIYRDADTYFQVTMYAPLRDDHDFSGGFDFRLYYKGEIIVNRPGGYAVVHTTYNSGAIKGRGWFPDRGTDEVYIEEDGTIVIKAHQRGPLPSYNWSPTPLFDYVGHEWLRTVKFNPTTKKIDVIDTWNTDGVFPDYTGNQYWDMWQLNSYKPFESRIFSVGTVPVKTDNTLEWTTTGGRKMKVTYSGVEEVKSGPIGWPVFDDLGFISNIFGSTSASGEHNMVIETGDFVGPPPPPPPPPPPEPVELPEAAVLAIVNNGDAGYRNVGIWIRFPGQGLGDEVDYTEKGDGSAKAIWTANVLPGKYSIATTWSPMTNRATDAHYKVLVDDTEKLDLRTNQELSPESGEVEVLATGKLSVILSNDTDEYVIADAVRIERIGDIVVVPPPPPPVVDVQITACLRTLADGSQELYFKIPKQS
jgi:hypothetical protein